MTKGTYYIPTLNGWRAISILLVILYHGLWFHISPGSNSPMPELWTFIKSGVHGVSIFFAISGYLISSRILEEIKNYGNFNIRDFYVKRFYRIVPPYLFYILTLMTLSMFFPLKMSSQEIISSLLFLRIYLIDLPGWYTAHFWSLCVEEHFYVLLSVLYKYFNFKVNKYLFLFFIFIITIWTIISYKYLHTPLRINIGKYLKVFLEMKYMFWGALFALSKGHPILIKLKKLAEIPHLADGTFIILLLSIFFPFPMKHMLLPIIIIISIFISIHGVKSFSFKILESSVCSYIGKISYSLYLWQQFFFTTETRNIKGLESIQVNSMSLVYLFIVASLSHFIIERPFIKLGRKFILHKL